jgi:hypothetical protein
MMPEFEIVPLQGAQARKAFAGRRGQIIREYVNYIRQVGLAGLGLLRARRTQLSGGGWGKRPRHWEPTWLSSALEKRCTSGWCQRAKSTPGEAAGPKVGPTSWGICGESTFTSL